MSKYQMSSNNDKFSVHTQYIVAHATEKDKVE